MTRIFAKKQWRCLICIGLLALAVPPLLAEPVAPPLQRAALAAASAASSVMLDVVRVGERLVAVGERGLVLLSDDDGANWRQARVPVAVTLTAVAFPSPLLGWAVGHSGVVLHTRDRGETWVKQLDGVEAAELALAEAQAALSVAPEDEAAQAMHRAAKWLVKDGADKPFLDLHFADERSGFIVGAYGLFFATEDGGATWSARITGSDNPMGMNLYAIGSDGASLYLAGEQGFFARSDDGGKHFTRIETPYDGTWFVLAFPGPGSLFLGGLRGNAYLYESQQDNFTKVESSWAASFNSALSLDDGRLLLVNQAGQVLESRDGGRTLQLRQRPPGAPLVALAPGASRDSLIGAGFGGLARLSGNPTTSGERP
jgi:photosystem II stability/assembly factor-like uncharacterized protein